MLESFYQNLGFFGALFVSFFLFIFIIFWIAGIAGISLPYDGGRKRGNSWQIICAVFIPFYPVVWLIIDMYMQHKYMNEE